MKFSDIILLILVSGIGFVFPWWSLFILCFFWGYFDLSSARKIFVLVFLSHTLLILSEGLDLIQVLKFSQAKYLFVPLAALIFAGISAVLARTGAEFKKSALEKLDPTHRAGR